MKPLQLKQTLAEGNMNHEGIWVEVATATQINNINQTEQLFNLELEMLSQETLKHFKLFRNPFMDDVREPKDVFLSPDAHYILAAMRDVARNQGILAVIGDSGAGKTVLRKVLMDELRREGDIATISPHIFDKTRITATSLCDSIIADISSENPKRALEAKARQVERLLRMAAQGGRRHVLVIEEAHDLSVPTLKYLKRFWEMEDGFNRLLGIILIGQTELKERLDERRNYEMRELIRRCIQVELEPLTKHLKDYLGFKFKRVGGDIGTILEDKAVDAIGKKLMRHDKHQGAYSIAHPLVVNGLIAKAMNMAVELGDALVTADLIKEV
jgi:type II secretory pathway predicted ATPase ExeA